MVPFNSIRQFWLKSLLSLISINIIYLKFQFQFTCVNPSSLSAIFFLGSHWNKLAKYDKFRTHLWDIEIFTIKVINQISLERINYYWCMYADILISFQRVWQKCAQCLIGTLNEIVVNNRDDFDFIGYINILQWME